MTTLKDIAEQAGVSIGTVDRIIHNRGRFSSDTADRVRSIMDELDYRPNVLARRLSQSRTCRIGVFIPWPEQDSHFWQMTLEGVERAQRELGPFGLNLEIVHFDRYDGPGVLESGRRIFEEDFDGVLMAPLNEKESRLLLDTLDPGVPLLFFDTDLPGTSRLAFIGQDSLASGKIAGRLMNLLTSEKPEGRVLILTPDTSNEHLQNRIRGFQESFRRDVRLIRITIESDHDLAALNRMLDAEMVSRPAGIFVTDASAHYAAEYFSRFSNMPGRSCAIIGYDLVPENRKWLEEGSIDFLLTQRPDEQGYDGINHLFRKIVLGENPPEHIFTPIDIVTRENLVYFPGQQTKEAAL